MVVEDSFFAPCGTTSLATHATSTYYWFFWINLFKAQNKLISHGLGSHGLRDLYFKRRIHGPHFLFINLIHNPWHHQHQHMDWAQAMNQSSRSILPLLHSWKVASPTKAHIYTKWQQNPRYIISPSAYDLSSWISLGKLWELWFGGPRGMFSKAPVV